MQERISRLLRQVGEGLFEKDQALALGILALAAGESLFLLGPPGTAKSLVARRLKAAFQEARCFEYLMGRFSTPEEIFGPLSIAGLRDRDVFERRTEGYLPEADIAFLDEIWRASPPIQNTLLALLNEKVFRNGSHELAVPLKLLIGASNSLPAESENSEAFWDRFILRLEVQPIEVEENFTRLLESRGDLYHPIVDPADQISADDWSNFRPAIDNVTLDPVCKKAFLALREDLSEEHYISDRRWKKAARIVKAAAFLHGRTETDPLDLGVLEHILWHDPVQKAKVTEILQGVLEEFGWESAFDLESLEKQEEQIREGLRQLTLRQTTQTRPRPVLYDGEYFVLLGYPSELQARVWAQDFQLLKPHEEIEGELFFFRPAGAFVRSEPHQLGTAGGPADLTVNGRLFALESREETVQVFEKLAPNGPALKTWEQDVRTFIGELETMKQRLAQKEGEKTQEGRRHLFCPSYVESCRVPLQRLQSDLEQLIVRMEYLLETRRLEDA